MTDTSLLAQRLADAHKAGRHDVDPTTYAALVRAEAFDIQQRVMSALGHTPGLIKTAIAPDGTGIVAPIYARYFGTSGSFQLPSANVVGLELEVGLVLNADVDGADEAATLAAIDHYFVGIEICGTRYTDRAAAGATGGLADNMSALGYVRDPLPRQAGTTIDGMTVTLEFAGKPIHSAVAKHSFGIVLASYLAYARSQQPFLPLRAGTVITTGSLCGLVPITGTGHVVGRLGDHTVTLDMV